MPTTPAGPLARLIEWLFNAAALSPLHHDLIVVHVATALVAMVLGVVAMSVRKGGRRHIRVGRLYVWSILASSGTAAVLLGFRFNLFLFGVTVLASYTAVAGYRTQQRKQMPPPGDAWARFDVAIAGLCAATGVFLIGLWGSDE